MVKTVWKSCPFNVSQVAQQNYFRLGSLPWNLSPLAKRQYTRDFVTSLRINQALFCGQRTHGASWQVMSFSVSSSRRHAGKLCFGYSLKYEAVKYVMMTEDVCVTCDVSLRRFKGLVSCMFHVFLHFIFINCGFSILFW